jgi:hypothetical protein
MSRITTTQLGIIGQQEFAKLLVLGSHGELEVATPMTDDERRDLEAHRRGLFARYLAFQVKVSAHLEHQRSAHHLQIKFAVSKERVKSHPLFWYFFGFLDPRTMAFGNPVFLVPSRYIHIHASPREQRGKVLFQFYANMSSTARDRWKPYRLSPSAVGRHVLDVLEAKGVEPKTLAILPDGHSGLSPGLWVIGQQVRDPAAQPTRPAGRSRRPSHAARSGTH